MKPTEYRIEWVPFHERGPIAAFQLQAVRESGLPIPEGVPVLPYLDACQCMALVGKLEDHERLDGLVYLSKGPAGAAIMLYWVREGTPSVGVHMLNVGLDDWMVDNKLKVVRGTMKRCPSGFRKTGAVVVERVLE